MPSPVDILALNRHAVVAPAGHGKTELIAQVSSLGRRTLILTHTHAGVHAIKARMKRMGIPSSMAAVDTIAGWASRYAYAFPRRANPPVGTPRGAAWNDVYRGTAAILKNPAVRRVVEASYDRILIDEYQDCEGLQHQIALRLSSVLPTVVFGDPMQGIFEFVESRIQWSTTVAPAFPVAYELEEPHRWNLLNPDLGTWIAEVRLRLIRGEPIDLRRGPVQFVPCTDEFNMGLFFDGLDDRHGSVAAIHCYRPVCNQLAKSTKGAFQSIEEIAAARLIAFAEVWDGSTTAQQRADALGALMREGIARSDTVPEGGIDGTIEQDLADAWAALSQSGSPKDALRLLRCERSHPQSRMFRGELLGDARRALTELDNGRQTRLVTAAESMRQRLSHMGRAPLKRTVSTPLLLKGLEFDHVLIPDATHFLRQKRAQAKLFYVAISRARQSLTIASRTPIIQFPIPLL